jgi:hypothetical protein
MDLVKQQATLIHLKEVSKQILNPDLTRIHTKVLKEIFRYIELSPNAINLLELSMEV